MRVKRILRANDCDGRLDGRLAAYLAAAGAVGTAMASEAQAVIVFNDTPQPFGIDGAVPIDFNSDGQVDYEIDHDNIDVDPGAGVNLVDYLQIDKNDTNGASPGENPCPINVFDTFDPNGTDLNNTADAGYVINGPQGSYPAALEARTLIGPASTFDFQEGDNFGGTGQTIRANRLIDEDAGACDEGICGLSEAQTFEPLAPANFTGLGGDVAYLGVRMHMADDPGTNSRITFGWIGIRITDEANATGEVVGWAYNDSGGAIRAGQIPEPASILSALIGGAMLALCFLRRRFRR
jgi:hypothetical protein